MSGVPLPSEAFGFIESGRRQKVCYLVAKATVLPRSTTRAGCQSIVWVQRRRGLRVTRVRGVPLAGEAFDFGDVGGDQLSG